MAHTRDPDLENRKLRKGNTLFSEGDVDKQCHDGSRGRSSI